MKQETPTAVLISAGALIGAVTGLALLLLVKVLFFPSRPVAAVSPPAYNAPVAGPPVRPPIQNGPVAGPGPGSPPAPSQPASTVGQSALQQLVEAEASRIPGTVSVHVRVDGGVQAGVRQNEPMPAASVIKLPIMAAVQASWRSGFLKRTAVDEKRMRDMITLSDNDSADALIDRVGMSQVGDWLRQRGYSATKLRRKMSDPRPGDPNIVTAAEMTQMALAISRGELIDPAASDEMRRLMLQQTRRNRIPAGLPPEVPVGNKTGSLRGIVNDVAFVEPPGGPRYAVAVLVSNAGLDTTTSAAIARLSKSVYEFLTAR